MNILEVDHIIGMQTLYDPFCITAVNLPLWVKLLCNKVYCYELNTRTKCTFNAPLAPIEMNTWFQGEFSFPADSPALAGNSNIIHEGKRAF